MKIAPAAWGRLPLRDRPARDSLGPAVGEVSAEGVEPDPGEYVEPRLVDAHLVEHLRASSSLRLGRSASNGASRKIASAGGGVVVLRSSSPRLVSITNVEGVGLAVSRDSLKTAEYRVGDSAWVPPAWPSLLRNRRGSRPHKELVPARFLLQPRDRLLDGLQVGQDHLGLDGGDVRAQGFCTSPWSVGDVLVPGKRSVTRQAPRPQRSVREELVCEPLPLGRALEAMPAMSTNSTVAGRILADAKISASLPRRSSGTATTPTLSWIRAANR